MKYIFINTEYIDSVAGGEKDVIREILVMFQAQVAEMASEMKDLLGKKDYYNLGLLAHKAKSSVAIMGMSELAAFLKKFELEAREGANQENYATYVSKFESDTKGASEEIDSYLANLK